MAELLTKIKKPTRRGAVALWVVLGLVVLWLLLHLRDIAWMFGQMGDFLTYKFIQRALIVGTLVSLTAALLGVTKSAVSHQLKALRLANLVKFRREGQVVYYSLADDHVRLILEMGFEHIRE